ncbi:MAG: hypothetical protein IT168_02730 [Bryobacterales bacterium]|nr:hypothetical protein [Bryobacterales bacterium]
MIPRSALLLAAALFSTGVLSAQSISASPAALDFYYQIGTGINPAQQNIQINGPSALAVAISSSVTGANTNWLFPLGSNPASVPFSLGVIVAPASLPAGTYTGNIRISPLNSSIAPLDIPIRFTISALPLMIPVPSSLTFTQIVGAAAPPSQTVNLTATSTVSFSAAAETSSGGSWLSISPASGTTPQGIVVSVNQTGLPIGTYNGLIRVVSATAANSPLTIPITYRVTEEIKLTASPASLSFDFQLGGAPPSDQAISVQTTAVATTFTATAATQSGGNWLNISTTSGNTPSNVGVSINPAGLAAGTYQGTITFSAGGASNNPQVVDVSLRVSADPILRVSPGSLTYTYQINGPAIPAQAVIVSSSNTPITFTATASGVGGGGATAAWLTVTQSSTTTPSALVVNVNPTGLTAGTYTGAVVLTGQGAANSLTIPVSLEVSSSSLLRLSTNQLTFYHQVGQAAPLPKKFAVSATGNPFTVFASATVNSGADWLSVTPATGAAPSELTVSVNPANLPAGLYSGAISVRSAEANSTAINLPVRLLVDINPQIVLPSSSLEFTQAVGGSLPANQSFTVGTSSTPLNFSVTAAPAASWLIVAPDNGVTGSPSATVNVGVSTGGIAQGTYTGILTVTSPGAANSPQYIPVVLRIIQQTELVVPTDRLTFNQTLGGAAPAARQLTIRTNPAIPLRFDATANTFSGGSWLTVEPSVGLTEATITIRANTQGLAAGNYDGEVIVSSSGAINTPRRIPVTLSITRPLPNIAANRTSIPFTYSTNSPAPQGQQVQITSDGDAVPLTITTATTSGGTWLFVSSSSTATPATLNLTVNPSGLTAGAYNGTVTVASPGAANSPLTLNVTLTVSSVTLPVISGVANSANLQFTSLSPGLLVVLYGTGIGPTQLSGPTVTPQGFFDTTVANTRVLFDDSAAPIYYVSATQSAVLVPYQVAGRATVQVAVEVNGVRSAPVTVRVVDAAPGIYTANSSGTGQAAAVNLDGGYNSAQKPVARGGMIILYGTGEGLVTPPGVNGQITNASNLKRPIQQVRVRIGGLESLVEYAGSAPSIIAGVMQLNVRVPENVNPGPAVPIELIVGNVSSPPGVTIAVR